jgi:hypothetical protein
MRSRRREVEILNMKTALKLKITLIFGCNIGCYVYPIKPSAGLPNLMRLSL